MSDDGAGLTAGIARWFAVPPRLVDRTSRHYPLVGLARDGRDEFEVVVVVEHYQSGGFGCSCDEEIGDLRSSLLASCREQILDGDGAVEHGLIHWNERPGRPSLSHGLMRSRASG